VRLFRLVISLTAVAIIVFAAGIALGQPPANAVRALPDTVERGEQFEVTVNFTAPGDEFNSIALTDFAPDGWDVTASGSWSTPSATVNVSGNEVQFSWWTQLWPSGKNFTALYKVTVPCDADLTNYTFDGGNAAFLAYYLGNSSQIWENITGDSNVTVVRPAICSAPSISFYAAYNETNPPNQTLELRSSTPCMLNWSLSDDAAWLNETPKNGNCTDVPSPVVLSVNSSGMPFGNYTANITIQSPDANNSPRIVPVTLQITTTGILKGQVSFPRVEPKGDPTWETGLVVKGFEPGNLTNELWSKNATTNNTGIFTIEDVYPGIYDIGIKNWTCLSVLNTSVAFTVANVTVVDFGEVLEGDANNDDIIGSSDYSLLSFAYNTWPAGPPKWDPNCDFNRDDYVGSSDYSILSLNYNKWGALY